MKRWTAAITYRTDAGAVVTVHEIEELDELQEIVERGPHFDTIMSIEITRYCPMIPGLTLEKSFTL